MAKIQVLFTTNPGIEDIVSWEAEHRLGARIVEERRARGRVVVEIDEDQLYLVEYMKSIHRPRILLYRGPACREMDCLEREIRRAVESSGLEHYLASASSFAVRAERSGDHRYTSIDVARLAGKAVQDYMYSRTGRAPRVDLDYPNVIVSVDVLFDELFFSVELGGDISWHRRGYRVYNHPAALKPTLAYAMLVISGARDGDSILDSMCGGGTIPIEAALLYESSRLYCSDKNPRHVSGARLNARAALVENRIEFRVADARKLSKYYREVDYIVANPPYGIRMGRPVPVRETYRDFIREATSIVGKGVVLITTEYETVKKEAEKHGWRTVHERTVAHGSLWLKIIAIAP